MEIDYAVYSLSDEFYEKYPNPPYKELLKKKERRYACLLIQSHYGYFICMLMATLDGNTKTLLPVSELPCILSLIQ